MDSSNAPRGTCSQCSGHGALAAKGGLCCAGRHMPELTLAMRAYLHACWGMGAAGLQIHLRNPGRLASMGRQWLRGTINLPEVSANPTQAAQCRSTHATTFGPVQVPLRPHAALRFLAARSDVQAPSPSRTVVKAQGTRRRRGGLDHTPAHGTPATGSRGWTRCTLARPCLPEFSCQA